MNKSDRNLDFVFVKMIELVEKGWQQGIMAKNSKGEPCYVEDRDAVSFDLYGAFCATFFRHQYLLPYREKAIKAICEALNCTGEKKHMADMAKPITWHHHLNKFNDEFGRQKMEVVRMLEKAREKAE